MPTEPQRPSEEPLQRRDGERPLNGNGADHAPPRFILTPFDNIQLGTRRYFTVRDVVPREGLGLIWGQPACGKSFFAFDLAMHIALGWEYRGHKVAQGSVVYVACEGVQGIAQRAQAYRLKKLQDSSDPIPFYLVASKLDLINEIAKLKQDIALQCKTPAVIFIDTLNRSMSGSENRDEDMARYYKAADELRELFACCVIIIHHSGHADEHARGHSSIKGAVDMEIQVQKTAETHLVTATVIKMKDGQDGAIIAGTLEVVDLGLDEDGEEMTSCVIVPAENQEAPRPQKKLGAAPKQAYDILRTIIAEVGIESPVSNHIPAGRKGVTKRLWSEYLQKSGVISDKEHHREQLRRIIVTLKDADKIGVWDDFVWTVTDRHRPSQ